MKNLFFLALALCSCLPLTADDFIFNHGPYLQNLTEESVTLFFTTSHEAYSRVEVRKKGGDRIESFVSEEAGLIQAYNKENRILLSPLAPNTEYEYRLISKEMTEFRPYHIVYGDSIVSPWEGFKTLNPKGTFWSFVELSDIHDDAAKLKNLLDRMPLDVSDMVFYNGDINSYYEKEGAPYHSFIDVSVEKFAKNKPFVVVRGNHETRGSLARSYGKFIGRPNGRYYNIYYVGNTAVVVLDTGEDKPDSSAVYAGLCNFDNYRREQAQWLQEQIKSKRFKQTEHRIVIMHIPPVNRKEEIGYEEHASSQLEKLFTKIFNEAKIDLLICGHTHRHLYFSPLSGDNNYPIVINDNKSAAYVQVSDEGIFVKVINTEGEVVFEEIFEPNK